MDEGKKGGKVKKREKKRVNERARKVIRLAKIKRSEYVSLN